MKAVSPQNDWVPKPSPLAYLVAMHSYKEVGEAAWVEGRVWACVAGANTFAAKTKIQAIRWLLEVCPPGTAVNEISHQWERLPSSV